MGHYILITIITERVVSSFGKKKSSRLGRFAQQFSLCIACHPSLVCMCILPLLYSLAETMQNSKLQYIWQQIFVMNSVGKAKLASFGKIPFCSYFLMIYLG